MNGVCAVSMSFVARILIVSISYVLFSCSPSDSVVPLQVADSTTTEESSAVVRSVEAFTVPIAPFREDVSRNKRLRIVTWNVREIFSSRDVSKRRKDFENFSKQLKPDVLILQEFTSHKLAREIVNAMKLQGYYVASTNFKPSDSPSHSDFEVAIASRYPITEAIEFDPTPDNRRSDLKERKLVPPRLRGLVKVGTSRGFLRVRIDALKLVVYGVHLKSSRGKSGNQDVGNARKREWVMAAAAKEITRDVTRYGSRGYSLLIGGDFNVGHSAWKNGTDLRVDVTEKNASGDKYDETHALLGNGLVGNLRMKNLTGSITGSTYPAFRGSPIDNIYFLRSGMHRFYDAKVKRRLFRSDHYPVYCDFYLN